ncbi:MAG: hypothetical protein M3N13_09350, partial [Candidatus Eremiobacteraeota bacterium]|nr:hypothetical protein [Candidatus Eremiobacteraeota bacterium]
VGRGGDPDPLATWFVRYGRRLSLERRNDGARAISMDQVNPKYVLRNYVAQRAIERAMLGDYSEIVSVHETLRSPFDSWPEREGDANPPPAEAPDIVVSCSS